MEFPASRGAQRTIRKGVGLLLLGAGIGSCTDRERLTFQPEGDQRGPITFIDQPGTGDTTVRAGPGMPLSGRTIDADGVDTVYLVVLGGNETFEPFPIQRDTARFGVQISTTGQAGHTLLVLVFGTDRLGNRGDTAVRRVTVVP